MDWGAHLPHLGRSVDRASLVEFVQTIETLGFHSGWVSDHVCWPVAIESRYPGNASGEFQDPHMGWLDPLGTLLFVAACTERLRLGTTVLILPYRPPVLTAKQLATLDVLSEGRLIVGAGVGWMREEAEVLGMPWDHRGARSNEQLELMRALFNDPTPSYHGEYYQIPEVGFEPKPLQDPLPIWIGGFTSAAFERAARFGQGFQTAFQPPDAVATQWAGVRAACEARNRDPAELTPSARVYLDSTGTMDAERSIVGSVDQMLEQVACLQQIGVTHVLLDPVARGGVSGRLNALTQFMEEVAYKMY